MLTIKKKITKCLAYLLCALLLSCSVLEAGTVPVKAAGLDAPFTQMLDIALNKVGISANLTTLQKLEETYIDNLAEVYERYKLYLAENDLTYSKETWADYLSVTDFGEDIILTADFVAYLALYDDNIVVETVAETIQTLIRDKLKASFMQSDGDDYVIPDAVVDGNKEVFDDMIKDYTGYYYIKTLTTDELLASYFDTIADYNNFCEYVKSSDNVTMLMISTSGSVNDGTFLSYGNKRIYSNSVSPYLVRSAVFDSTSALYFYDDNCEDSNVEYYDLGLANKWNVPFVDYDSFTGYISGTDYYRNNSAFYGYLEHDGSKFSWCNVFVFTNDGRKIKVYKSKDDLMNILAGTDPYHYYINSTYNYSTSNDNSIKVTGDYLTDNSNTYSYETITNEIDNSQDNSYTYVDNSITNIVNNYSSSSGSSSDSGDSSGGSDTNIWDALTALIGGIGDILEFIITAIAEVISLLGTFLTKIMEIVGSFEGISGDFFLFVGDFFPFIPQEIWDVILLGVTATVGICLFKAFKK